ncbi:apoptosis-inducing factor 3-like isoform X2 [Cylas formicarius]|uniref:apoptosis-inducing factor 3-like isoform X2 n=1 Tax=Cylas formicarius TaxID=197179 RepID=UPI002958AB43|nr:apoptosis-inducing factor 3-like isoform X2 [Cylas formicarius]
MFVIRRSVVKLQKQITCPLTAKGTLKDAKMQSSNSNDDFVEGVVCKVRDVCENEMKTFDLGEHKILLVKQNGIINALGTKCTHYGAPLVNGALGRGRIRCQWHGACFNVSTGDIEDFPGLDSLPCYKVTVDGEDVKVRAKKSELEANKRRKTMAKKRSCVTEKILVIGGGPAAATCVETLRQEGFRGEITLVCRENSLPYDRIKLSKAMDADVKTLQFRDDAFYAENGITVLKGRSAVSVDTGAKSVRLDDDQSLKYDQLFLATGSHARKLKVPGSDLRNVFVLREFEDGGAILRQLAKDKEVVIIGSSFIGMEVANYCVDKVRKVTVVGRDSVPFRPVWGEKIGSAILNLFKGKGVHFVGQSGIKRVIGDDAGAVASIELIDGSLLKADALVAGIGAAPNTDFLQGSGLNLRPDGSIETDEYLRTEVGGVYAGGDIAYAPVWCEGNAKAVIGHFGLAHYHGRIAALNMLGANRPVSNVPFFWATLFGKSFRYAGHGAFDDVVYTGDVDALKFVAFFLRKGVVVSVAACGMDPVASQFAEHASLGKKLYREDVSGDSVLDWTAAS